MELLAPAGSLAAFEAALAEGADAVYVGAPALSARSMAREVSLTEIRAMTAYAHDRKRKLYIAMNSLVREDEIGLVVDALAQLAEFKADALIVQDPGVMALARRFFPDLPVHASTLMSVHNSLAARWLVDSGCQRVVLARELTIKEIQEIGRRSGAELEIFIHGAMCFSYSGLCLFSSLHGGKSSLRGQCVQPCRRRYTRQKSRPETGKKGRPGPGGYLFSMNDLCGIELLPALKRAGVASLKIEGRLKSVQYVRNTTRAYRMVIDSLGETDQKQRQALAEARQWLDEAMGRRRSTGYFLDSRPVGAVSPSISGNTGVLVGQVQGVEKRGGQLFLKVRLRMDVAVGERLRFHDETSGDRQGFTLQVLWVGNRRVQRARSGQKVGMGLPGRHGKKGRLSGQGFLFRVDVQGRARSEKPSRELADGVKQKLSGPDPGRVRTILDALPWQAGRGHTVSQARPNRERRKKRAGKGPFQWWIRLKSLSVPGRRLPMRPARILVPLNRKNSEQALAEQGRSGRFPRHLVWCLPPVIQEGDLDWFGQRARLLAAAGFTEYQIGHLSQQGLFAGLGDRVHLYGDYTLNLLNSQSLAACRDQGLEAVQFSLETDRDTLAQALFGFRKNEGRSMRVGCTVYGRPPLFTSRLAADHLQPRQTVASPRGERFVLDQENGLTLARAEQPFSLLHRRDELIRLGVDYLVVDLSGGPLNRELDLLARLMRGSGRQPAVLTGNYDTTLV